MSGVSLGEQPHSPDGCHAAGGPHLGPCLSEPDAAECTKDRALIAVDVVDEVTPWMREQLDHRDQPYADQHDYRFHLVYETAGGGNAEVTFSRDCTAADVYAYCKREGWVPNDG